ncbi:MAG: ParE family toxin-like protein [Candidatus Anammoxibacter sp.]
MISRKNERFRKLFARLPIEIQKKTDRTYSLFKQDLFCPSLHFKRVHSTRPIYSVRITDDYRAVGILQNSEIIWFWVGSHSEYSKLLVQL